MTDQPTPTPDTIDTRTVQGLIEIAQRYYAQLSTGDRMLVEAAAQQMAQAQQRQMLAGLPGLAAPGAMPTETPHEAVPAPHPDAPAHPSAEPALRPNGAGVGADGLDHPAR